MTNLNDTGFPEIYMTPLPAKLLVVEGSVSTNPES